MNLREFSIISESFLEDSVPPSKLDDLLSEGWRHFGQYFFRYNLALHDEQFRFVIPLRIRLWEFSVSKSQRRVIRKNSDLQIHFGPAVVTEEMESLFERHKKRFVRGIPDSIYDFIDREPDHVPCKGFSVSALDHSGKLMAVSLLDIGSESVSGIYAMFDPDESRRSLGIYTMLLELELAAAFGKRFYYQGYAYEGSSSYDYKKQFSGLERFDWNGNWL